MEATAISIGKSVLSGALNYAQSAVAEEVALQLGVQRDHSFISDELEMMRGFLMAAHDERDDNMVVKIWVKQVRDVSYAVEDCLLDFAVRLENQSWWCLSRKVLARRYVVEQMKELRAKVEEVSQRNQRYHLIKSSSSKPASGVGQPTISSTVTLSADDEARGQHNKAKMDLVGLINNKDDDLNVIAVWETTAGDLGDMQSIVKSVYEDPKIRKKFECHAWIRFMLPFNLIDFIQSIVTQFYVNCLLDAREEEKVIRRAQILKLMGTPNNDDLPHEFRTYLNEKSYLIVLEDVHTIEKWNYITAWFPKNKKGSRIMVSTKEVKVANLCIGEENGAPEHKQLLDNQTVHAFYKKGFQDGKFPEEAGSSSDIISEDTDSSTHMEVQGVDSLEESQLIGRESEKEKVIQLFSHNSDQQVRVISLWGMGGVGKTTLVRDIYQRKEISGMFEKRACVTVMRPFNCIALLQSLVVQLREKKEETDLATCLKQKRYFLIIDDLSSTTEWDAIKEHLPETAGSCIIITTREKNIAEHCSKVETNHIIQLNNLCPDDARVLFTKKVFKKTINLDEQYPDLVEQAKLILRKCGGLPLALITIGGFLANQPKIAFEWRKLNEHISAELEMNPDLETIKAVLMKRYDGLPYYLKACFLYLAIFPEDQQIARRRLVRRWLAEGYSSEMCGKSVEEVLDSYFMELISRSMILPSQLSIHSRKGIDSCHVHDLIREIAISKAMEENLAFTLEEGCSLNNQGTVRHLAVSSDWKGDQSEFENIVDLSRIRPLTVFGNWKPFYISDKMRLLRVLDLEGKWDLVDHHLEHIGKLVHLRYLSLRGHADIFHLPNSLGNLRQLQTLDISGTSIVKLPRTIIKLVKMQRILASEIGDMQPNIYANRQSIMTLPLNSIRCCLACCVPNHVGKEILGLADGILKRRDVCTAFCCSILPYYAAGRNRGGVEVARGIWKLKALHTLRVVDISVGKAALEDIEKLTRLRKLGLTGISKRNSQELCSAIACLSSLESLSLRSHGETCLSGCLDGLSSPPENLQSLKLIGNLVKLPEWIQDLKNLMKLKLEGSRISDQDAAIQVLGSLPNLAILRLLYSFDGEEVRFSFRREAFPSLKVLELNCIGNLKSVGFEEGAAPKLELLQYIGWSASLRVGLFSGLLYLPSLKEFMLYRGNWGKTEFVEHLQLPFHLSLFSCSTIELM
ncbi:disease resistance protein Pik-2-like [Triticum dicoccoides]|uniref:disease resistance protein Pik-2-like n=1 Tax=Triticum dicoccoides TaxID=85692 RepID=UPI000E7AB228|nr:disease resistance protein Pik-2-like [Triticum dicoccoides]XP_037416159.1 disease resistance protein Pik-2-like [Triticum dicoccoides]XP_037416160.1 disease resistance protein Pik-2-like [Triticum dicoccoides]XP_037416161.1 disease resistance protein Pik-2-like [Triticum dicoccoides]XP_037416162.1 disease resistance protein Pik-2-like [Triticum dicoccoides]XP_037416163.1 disease resistance protein Pik-2-like [Triticum dicoccoides]XP_037416164.1 disease resistance protein Pik-2-like [Triti